MLNANNPISVNVESKRVLHLDWLDLLPVSHITALLECQHCGLLRVCGLKEAEGRGTLRGGP